ncbi:MAG: hypothetical protein JWO11_2788, partial [Nocardioides sp.]|nr:hypothetical protein [Nocardioides sp.]
RVQTPRRWGEPFRAGVLFFDTLSWRPLRTNWLIVGTGWFPFVLALSTRRSAGHDVLRVCPGVQTQGTLLAHEVGRVARRTSSPTIR